MDVLFDGRDKLYLDIGWEKFARYHDLEFGCVLTFSYLGDADMSVKVFDKRCRRYYHDDNDERTIEHAESDASQLQQGVDALLNLAMGPAARMNDAAGSSVVPRLIARSEGDMEVDNDPEGADD
nr:B3 domain-containing protein Os03g0212300-like [Lolium perenne]